MDFIYDIVGLAADYPLVIPITGLDLSPVAGTLNTVYCTDIEPVIHHLLYLEMGCNINSVCFTPAPAILTVILPLCTIDVVRCGLDISVMRESGHALPFRCLH
jgi:hypothetical protein